MNALHRCVRDWFPGHGFTFTPAIGRVLADLATGIPAPSLFRAPRAQPSPY
ncbi:hypothetical protein ACX80E_03010 [Arthrobacter sp. TMN-49]